MTPPPRTIAIPIVAGIGNALMAIPMVRRLKRALPNTRVIIVARIKPMAEIFERLPEVDEVRLMGTGPRRSWSAMRHLRRDGIDTFLIPFPSNRWQYMALA